jgi:hypothetical protein
MATERIVYSSGTNIDTKYHHLLRNKEMDRSYQKQVRLQKCRIVYLETQLSLAAKAATEATEAHAKGIKVRA